jgi:hypothetical protein
MGQSALKLLPGEEGRGEFRTQHQLVRLTNQRLIFEGETRRFFVFPGGRVIAAAMLQDVDVAFLGRIHVLPTWAGLVGAGVFLGALGMESLLGILLGAGIVAAWYFFGATVLEFRVDGLPLATIGVVSLGGLDQELGGARDFVDAFFAAKAKALHPA